MIDDKPTRRTTIRSILAFHHWLAAGESGGWGSAPSAGECARPSVYPLPLLAAVGGMRR